MKNQVLETIQQRSSTRAYTKEELTNEQVQALVNAALQAPTARNNQELFFSVANTNSDVIQEMNAEMNAARGVEDPEKTFFYNAPLLILISARENVTFEGVDAGIAVQSIALAAQSMGLGSVIIGCVKPLLKGERKAYYNDKLGVPEEYSFEIAIAIGHIESTKVPHEYTEQGFVSYIK
ncbi:MAG: nitroreductase family protein [Bacillota bacterium]|nr:nitroreductase family protein [Bacillota bacterium]